MRLRAVFLSLCLAMFMAGCAGPRVDYAALLASPDREEADRQNDARRKQPQLIAFTGVAPGMRVLDMGAGGGYTTELLARAVGSTGRVVAQDATDTLERIRARFDARAKKPVMANVERALRPFDDPVPSGAAPFDLVTFFFAYHDTTYIPVDRAKMSRALFAALKPGGVLVVADHSARAGDGINVAKSLHRIEEAVVRREFEAAGFRFVEEGGFLRNPADPRVESVFRNKVPNDEFVMRFVRP